MRIVDYIKGKKSDEILVSAELIPPFKGGDWAGIEEAVKLLGAAGVSWFSVTSHAHQYVEAIENQFVLKKRNARVNNEALCLALCMKHGIEVMPHLICSGLTVEEVEEALLQLHFFGMENVLALRGDGIPGEGSQMSLHHHFAHGLVQQIAKMNAGEMRNGDACPEGLRFCVGVAGYPEGHPEAASLKKDMEFLKAKVDAGADFIITQMFFDNAVFYRFVEAAEKAKIQIPILPGLKSIYKKIHLRRLPEIFHCTLPEKLKTQAEKCRDEAQVRTLGTEHTIRQCLELKANGVDCFHFFTMGVADPAAEIIQMIHQS